MMQAPATTLFNKEMVQRTIKYFADPSSVDLNDPIAMRDFISLFIKFEHVIQHGRVTADAKGLAQDFVIYAKDWLKKSKFEPLYLELKK